MSDQEYEDHVNPRGYEDDEYSDQEDQEMDEEKSQNSNSH